MTDYFAVLGLPRRPWLDPDAIKESFHRLSRDQHPDQHSPSPDGEIPDFATLNQAHQTLRDPKSRLRYLLSLEYPGVAVSGPAPIPDALGDLLFPTQQFLQEIDSFFGKRAAASGALGRALLAAEQFALREKVEAKLAVFEAQNEAFLENLRAFDQRWDPRPADAPSSLLGFYHGFAYLSRWIEQFRERLFQLSV